MLTSEQPPKVRVQSAARAVAILLAVARSSNGLKAKEISEILNLPRQTSYHLIHTLLATGTLRKSGQGRYLLGLAASSIADGFERQLEPAELLAPRVRAIIAATGETAYASGWIEDNVVALVTARGNAPVHAAEVPSGFKANAHARASGKLLLALADSRKREEYLSLHALVALTTRTIVSRDLLDKEFARIRERGHAVDDEEFAEGLCCLAVPLEGVENRFALCISVPKPRFEANRDRYLAILRDVARFDATDRLESHGGS
jgi:IclR family acetate operon transcriptional repressor